MPAIPHVIRRGAVYYWRRRLPSALAESSRSATLIVGLRTRDPRRARFLGTQISALADLLFADAMDQRLDQTQLHAIFKDVFTRHLDKLEAVVARERAELDFDAEDSRRSDEVMAWAYRLLETRGRNAHVDKRAAEQMRAAGVDDRSMAETDLMLDAMRANNLVADRRTRLDAAIEGVGGIPHAMNHALAQQMIHKALAAANFESARRYDGIRTEDAAAVEAILRHRRAECERVGSFELPSTGGRQAGRRHNAADETNTEDGLTRKADTDIPVEKQSDKLDAPIAASSRILPKTRGSIPPEHHPIAVLGAKLIEKNAKIWDVKTQRQARQIYGLFAKVLSEKSVFEVADIRQSHFADLDDLLSAVAKSYGKSQQDQSRSTAELRAIGAAKPPAERGLAPETINRHMTFLGQLLNFLRSRGHSIDRDIDLSLLRAKTRGRPRDKRAIIDDDELDAIFKLPCFVGCAGWKGDLAFTEGQHVFHRGLYYAIILLYYTGARREEICGLKVDEVGWLQATDTEDKIPYIRIAPNDVRRIKNAQSQRFVALHPEVVRLGLFDYVAEIRRLGYTLVFPDLKSPTSSSPLGDRLYDEFSRGLRQAVPDASARKKAVHSLRKTFGNNLKKCGVPAEVRSDMLGHSGGNVTEEIYCDPIALSCMIRDRCKIPTVTGHLDRKPVTLLPWVRERKPPPFARPRRERIKGG